MAPSVVHLPDGQTFTAQPVFSGLFFKSNELNTRPAPFPAGWTVVLHTEGIEVPDQPDSHTTSNNSVNGQGGKHTHSRRFTQPTLQDDTIFISSISKPSSEEFEPARSPSRHIALMLWISLYWYFQQPEPSPYLETAQSRFTPAEARPKGEWRIRIKREGVLQGNNMIPKLERMGLISAMDSSVGTSVYETSDGWDDMYITQQSFWQIPFGLFLFTLQPKRHGSRPGSRPGSPIGSRTASPARGESGFRAGHDPHPSFGLLSADGPAAAAASSSSGLPSRPYYSASHLPTYYPPHALQYVVSPGGGVRHPARPKPPRMGEIFYTRYVPSAAKYLSFRVASASSSPVPFLGPTSGTPREHEHLTALSDTSLIQTWMASPRVSKFWGGYQPDFLTNSLNMKHSFPVIAMWDGVPFGYFELYWAKEDVLGKYLDVGDFDRGIHVFIGEEWARGKIPQWISSLAHWMFQFDNRTMNVYLEPRVDNDRFIQSLEKEGFLKERQISFPHKQSWAVKLGRDTWTGPRL
jgi:N5-hydroxyornithine acetyltransferase